VYAFFVLSGFLITSLLLHSRDDVASGQTTIRGALARFFGRRVLRIFPAYYAAVIGSFLLWPAIFRDDLPYNLAYLSNMRSMMLSRPMAVGHFWSLAVEEQFYIVWPWVVLLLPRRALGPTVLTCVAISPLWRGVALSIGLPHIKYTYPVWSQLDCLGLGALLAISGRAAGQLDLPWVRRAGLAGIAFFVGISLVTHALLGGFHVKGTGPGYAFSFVAGPVSVALASVYVVARAARGDSGVLGRVLGWEPLRLVGIVSYGVYVYHPFKKGGGPCDRSCARRDVAYVASVRGGGRVDDRLCFGIMAGDGAAAAIAAPGLARRAPRDRRGLSAVGLGRGGSIERR
jgi:peptidoglycan/LPS O-acetylase OafA/YrhL